MIGHMGLHTEGMTSATPPSGAAVHRVVLMAHAADVDASIAFYAMLGFGAVRVLRDREGRAYWAMLASGVGELMLARASGAIDAAQQAVLFYMYAADVRALREHLRSQGVADGGVYRGQAGPGDGTRVVFEVARPDYMPAGEIRVHDPDGYCVLVGQLK